MPKGSARKGNTLQSAFDRYITAGPPEADEVIIDVACGEVVSRRFVTPELEKAIKAVAGWSRAAFREDGATERMFREASALIREWSFSEVAEDVTCTYEGEVDAMVGQGRTTWTCPACGSAHDEDMSRFEPDPDRFHDDR